MAIYSSRIDPVPFQNCHSQSVLAVASNWQWEEFPMLQDLVMIFQQIIVTVGSAAALVIAATASRLLARLVARIAPKGTRTWKHTIDVGTNRIAVVVTVSSNPVGHKALPGAGNQ
jgi:hypothetical protein